MRAAFCRGVGRLVVQDVPRPTPGPGEVLVRVRNCGICGSDLHWYHDQMMIPAVCPGHEIAGQVAEVGAGGTGPKAGDRKSTRLNSSHVRISHAVFSLEKKQKMYALTQS